ncbi:uncharacterized protein PITG_09184 [Phytophthora infestans T30-4]|uniref:Uncharacterized protein n=1 Tax=Phytophthora infestans (strain T30-4) TaxID=403677 RepID=D0NBV9_PHYIT|nr:uncharacterized protein PITG_09184 [Phytophthora infestans T30-4]EEY55264.1 hypothetical protein PITG_09184 [Phytophthora infestans T30-4]|eukprot:XP_002903488.1 hypothetical protein PITG_09184 [Phytophthora infestans T30-4]
MRIAKVHFSFERKASSKEDSEAAIGRPTIGCGCTKASHLGLTSRIGHKFRLDKIKRVATPPVEIPPPLADPTLLTYTVSENTIPMTRLMWQQQRDLFKAKRLPSRIREVIIY